jgi:serine/threonine-protein kinase
MKKLGKFEIIEKVGQGAMGVVYKARDPFIDRIVALKTLTTGLSEDPNLLKRFYSEARSAGGLQHPNIVTIYELGHEGETPFIAMQFLNGESLDKLIDRQPNLPLSQKIGFLVYVCRALEYAHKQNPQVVHRDIKPGNVMVTSEGTVMVVDFGIARLGEGTRSQSAGMLIGTLGYMSPQLFRGGAADARSDIWATGVMFYELLAYRRPFQGDNAAALMSNIILEKPRSITEAAPGIPHDLQAVLERMLAKEADARYQGMDEVLMELEPIWRRLQQTEVSDLLANSLQLFESGDLENAKAKVSQIIQIDTSNTLAKSLLEKINAEVRRKQIIPQLMERVENAGRLLANGLVEDAKAEVEAALKLDSSFQPARELLGQAQAAIDRARNITQALRTSKQRMAEGALTEAQLQLDSVLEIDPGNAAAREQLNQIREERSRRERRKQREETLQRARAFWTNLQYEECINLLLAAQKQFPGDTEFAKLIESARQDQAEQRRQSLLTEARNLLSAQRFDDSLRALDLLLEQYPSDATAKNLRAHALQGRDQQRRDQRLAEGKTKLRAWLKQAKYEDALKQARQLSREFPDDFELAELIDFARTEQSQLEQKVRLDKFVQQAQRALTDGRFPEAIQFAEKALLEFPKNVNLTMILDRAKKEQGEKEKQELLKQRLREVERMLERQELTDAIDLARQTIATVGPDPRIAGALLKAQKELEFREQKKRQQEETVQIARTLLHAGKLGDATSILKGALDTQLFYPDDSRVTQLLTEIDKKKQSPPSPPASIPKAPIAPDPSPATSFGQALSSGSKGDPGKDYVYMRGTPVPEAPLSPDKHATAAAASATSFGTPDVQPIFAPPSESRIADVQATSFSAPAVERKPSVQDLTVPVAIQEPPKSAAVRTPAAPLAQEAPSGPSIGNLLRKPAALLAAGVVLLVGIGVSSYLIWPKSPKTIVPTPEEIALEKEAAQLLVERQFREAIDKYKAIADLQGKEAPEAKKEIGRIERFLANENSVMEQAKTAEARNDLGGAQQDYQRVIDLHGEKEGEAKSALDAVSAKVAGASETQIAENTFRKGVNDYTRRDYSAAELEFAQALNRSAQSWTRRSQAADYLRKTQGRLQQEKHVKRALDYFSAKNYDAAKNEANQAISAPDGDSTYKTQAQNLVASIPKPVMPSVINPPSGGSSGTTNPGPPKVDPSIQQIQQLTRDAQNLIQQGLFRAAAEKAAAIDQLRGDSSGLRQQISANVANKLREMEMRYQGTNKQDRAALVNLQSDLQKFAANAVNAETEARRQSGLIAADIDKIDRPPKEPPKETNGPAISPPVQTDERVAVQKVLDEYANAFSSKDLSRIRSVRRLSKNLQDAFKATFSKARIVKLVLTDCNVQLSGETAASVTCKQTIDIAVPGEPQHSQVLQTFGLQKENGGWIIVSPK